MTWIARVFGWLARRSLLYLLLVAALVAATLFTPLIESQWTRPGQTRARLDGLRAVEARLEAERSNAAAAYTASVERMRGASVAAIDARLAEARARLVRLEAERPTSGITARFLTGGPDAVLQDQRREIDITLATREIASLTAARRLALADATLLQYATLSERARQVDALRPLCANEQAALVAFDRQWLGQRVWNRRDRAAILARRDRTCGEYRRGRAAVERDIAAKRTALTAQASAARAFARRSGAIDTALTTATTALSAQIRDDSAVLDGTLRRKAEVFSDRVNLPGKLRAAALLLLLIVATPYLIRLFCYYVLAPLAMRWPRIALRVPGAGGAIPLADRSTVSVALRLDAGEELLIRQDYLQTSSEMGGKRTQFFLDWRKPVTSLASGLTFLTRIRGKGQVTNVSTVRDGLSEVTVLTLPPDTACILKPRALVAVAQPIDQPLRITSHWRLFSLHAWLTLQLRYLVFHGPARLVVKGGRGVRVERAEHGRIFGQDQLVGFSADLSYAVTRTETFWPYLRGREPLLKDRVDAGTGLLVIEETPLAGRKGGAVGGGLEGMIDAGLKVFGI